MTGTEADPYIFSTVSAQVPGYIANAIDGDSMAIIRSDNSIDIVEGTSSKILREMFEDESDIDRFMEYLIAKRAISDHNKMIDTRKAAEVAQTQYDDLKAIAESIEADLEKLRLSGGTEELGELEMSGSVLLSDIYKELKQANLERLQTKQLYLSKKNIVINDDIVIDQALNGAHQYAEKYIEQEAMFIKINEAVREMLYEGGIISEIQNKEFGEDNLAGNYAPKFRLIEDDILNHKDSMINDAIRNLSGKPTNLKRRTGSTLKITPPVLGQMANIAHAYEKAVNNMFKQMMVRLVEKAPESLGLKIIRHLNPDIFFEEFKEHKDGSITGGHKINNAAKRSSDPRGGYMEVLWDGTPVYYNINVEVSDFMQSLNQGVSQGAIDKILRGTSRNVSRMFTSANPVFAVGNSVKDAAVGTIQSVTGMTPYHIAESMAQLVSGHMTSEEKALWGKFKVSGGERMTLASNLKGENVTYGDLLGFKAQGKTQETIEIGFTALEFLSNYSEMIPRWTEYKRTIEQGGSDVMALHNANQVTVPFTQHGAFGNNELIISFMKSHIFLNAAIQGNHKFIRTAYDKGPKESAKFAGKYMAGIASLFALTMVAMKTDERRKNFLNTLAGKTPEELSKYLWLPNPMSEDGIVQIKIPEILGVMTGLAYMSFLENYTRHDYNMDEYMQGVTSFIPPALNLYNFKTFMLNVPPLIFKTIHGLTFNIKDFPKASPITPEYMKDMVKEERYTPYTSKSAIRMSETFQKLGIIDHTPDPMQMQYLVENTLGFAGKTAILWQLPNNPVYRSGNKRLMGGRFAGNFYDSEEIITRNLHTITKGGGDYSIDESVNVFLQKALYTEFNGFLKKIRPNYEAHPERLTTKNQNIYTNLVLDVAEFANSNPDSLEANIEAFKGMYEKMNHLANESGTIFTTTVKPGVKVNELVVKASEDNDIAVKKRYIKEAKAKGITMTPREASEKLKEDKFQKTLINRYMRKLKLE